MLWFSPMTYFTHTLTSCTHTEDARGWFVPERKTKPILKLGYSNGNALAIADLEFNILLILKKVFAF